MLENNEAKIRRVTTKYKHTHTAFVKALNKILAERLFKVQDAQELNDPEKVSSRWVNPILDGVRAHPILDGGGKKAPLG